MAGEGIRHIAEPALPDDPGSEISTDEWVAPHYILVWADVTPGTVEPPAPPAGWREFSVESGVSPNKHIFKGIKLPDGTVIPIVDVYV